MDAARQRRFTFNVQMYADAKSRILESGIVQIFRSAKASLRKDIILASLIINILSMSFPIVILQLYDRIIPNQALQTLSVLVAALVVIIFLETALRMTRILMMNRLGAEFEHNATLKLVDVIISAEYRHFEAHRHSAYLEKIKAVENVREAQFGQNILSVVDLPFVLLFLGVIWFFTGWLVLVPLILLLSFAGLSILFSRELYATLTERDKLFERRQNFLLEVLQGIQTLKPLAMEAHMLRRNERMQTKSASVIYHLAHLNNLIQASTSTLSQLVMVLFVMVGAFSAANGTLSIGALAAGSMLAGRLLQPASRVLNFWMQWQSAKIAEKKLLELLALPPERNARNTQEVTLLGAVSLANTSYEIAGTNRILIDNINLNIKAKEFITIVGDNGAGKTTLAKLLVGLLKPTQGLITFDGHKAEDLSPPSLRRQVALVPQRGALLNGTILENLTAFRRGDATKQAMQYAKDLGLAKDLGHMVDGLTTHIDSSLADNIPEGLRQRIVMIRALIGDSKIVIFDDANTGFDKENLKRFYDFLTKIKGRKTIIAMTQRKAIIHLSDRCYRLSGGHLNEVSSHLTRNSTQAKPVKASSNATSYVVGGKNRG